jgi:hypothetical protein
LLGSSARAHKESGNRLMAIPGWIVHVLVLGSIAMAAGTLLFGGGG